MVLDRYRICWRGCFPIRHKHHHGRCWQRVQGAPVDGIEQGWDLSEWRRFVITDWRRLFIPDDYSPHWRVGDSVDGPCARHKDTLSIWQQLNENQTCLWKHMKIRVLCTKPFGSEGECVLLLLIIIKIGWFQIYQNRSRFGRRLTVKRCGFVPGPVVFVAGQLFALIFLTSKDKTYPHYFKNIHHLNSFT